MLIKKRESAGLEHFNNSEDFTEYSNDMNGIYKNIEEYNLHEKHRILIVFDETMADMLSIKKINLIETELFIRHRKLNISFAFITQSFFAVQKHIALNSTHYFIITIPNIRELQQIAFSHLSDIEFKDFNNFYKKCTAKPYSLLAIDCTLVTDNSLRFRKNLLEKILKIFMAINDTVRDEKTV